MRPINRFLVQHGLTIAQNPCVSPDCCLDWERLRTKLLNRSSTEIIVHPKSHFETEAGEWSLVEDAVSGDCAWKFHAVEAEGADRALFDGAAASPTDAFFPASWDNLLRLKNMVQEFDPESTIFPTCGGSLGRGTLGIGARFTVLHWPAVEWAMSALDIPLTANQNSVPRELVYDVDAMLEKRLDTVPFPFIGARVPEGHQGQSIEGMSHGCVLSKLRNGFHRRRTPWSFNADHQPVGGNFDIREDTLVVGCVLATYITFDLSPELALASPAGPEEIDPRISSQVAERVAGLGLSLETSGFERLLRQVWPAMRKMRQRDEKYRRARERTFSTEVGRRYLRELSIDELPGLTAPETTAVMLALCEAFGIRIDFVAPAFGFQKNAPYGDDVHLRSLIERQWSVARKFDCGIGFHSGSGKSAANYRTMGEVTGGRLEIKTSGRYTYEMGVALCASSDPSDQVLWRDWYRFTIEMAVNGAFSDDPPERTAARGFINASLENAGASPARFESRAQCRGAIEALRPGPDHLFFVEYNFLFVLAAGGRADKSALGDHTPVGYAQRSRFYTISEEARLRFAKGVAGYICFLAENTGLAPAARCAAARTLLDRTQSYEAFLNGISK